jgi:threonine dehydrogenase-like Zn-dependent dehydrogenase
MKAIVFDDELKCVENYPVPEPKEKDALIRVGMAGICNTDIEITRGYLGFHGVIGHEFVGIVEKAPENAKNLIGKRVVGEINCGCGVCDYCKKGMGKHCQGRTTLGIQGKDGAFAQYVTLPIANLHLVPDSVSDEEAVFTEPLAAAFEITEQVRVKPTDNILVLGDGKLGLLCAFVLRLTEAHVTLAGRHETKLNIARNELPRGETTTRKHPMERSDTKPSRSKLRGMDPRGNQHIRALNITGEKPGDERAYDIVVEATGSTEGFKKALQLVKPRGTIVLKSTVAAPSEMNLAPLVIDEITLIGSRCGPFETALRALAQKHVDVKPLISGIYAFDRAQEAFEKAQEKGILKVIIDFQ